MSFANSNKFTFCLPISMVYLLYLTSVPRTSNTVLNRNGESGHPCLVLDFRGKSSSFL